MVARKNLSLSFWEKNKQTWNGDVECCGKKVDILKALAREGPIKKVTYERKSEGDEGLAVQVSEERAFWWEETASANGQKWE